MGVGVGRRLEVNVGTDDTHVLRTKYKFDI